MTKKTPEELKALRQANLAKAREVKANKAADTQPLTNTQENKEENKVVLTKEQFDEIMSRLSKAEEVKTATVSQIPQSSTDQFGRPVGIIEKFTADPLMYADPRPMLYDLPELQRFAFKQNFILDWEVDQLVYETKYGTSFSEPKFTLTLKQKRYDEDGNVKDGLVVRGRGIFFEDPSASIKEANALGMSITNANSREFLAEMRFLRMKDWLMERVNPRRPGSTKKKIKEEVIGGMVYQIEEYSHEVS
jgi:tetrahydromethanopterin S-methyltransferase subunit G